MSNHPVGRIMEEREGEMISPTVSGGRNPVVTSRLAHFLSPTAVSDESHALEVPSNACSSSDLNFSYTKKKSLRVKFPGWRCPPQKWNTWTDRMHSLHHSVWEKAGIREAIMNSTHVIHRNDDTIYGLVEKWCPETNTFMFPWGEATITLEDMMVLGGYSVLGDPVFSPVESYESKDVEDKLHSARSELSHTAAKKVSQSKWLEKFMDSGSEIEHEAFLAMWLSRFVFPTKTLDDTIGRHVLTTAVHLARDTKIALAPAVLASLYANLSEMKRALVSSKKLKCGGENEEDGILELFIFAPFQLVQVWVWERFCSLGPKPLPSEKGQPRFTKWSNLKVQNIEDVKLALDKEADLFLWRPYAMLRQSSLPFQIHRKEARWIAVGSSISEEQEILVRWLRVSELVGIDSKCIEQYLPHRVAMQFGFDQDVPGHVARADSSHISAWENYNREIRDERLYVPSCLFESDVTTRYLKWWKNGRPVWTRDPVNTDVLGVKSKGTEMDMPLSSLIKKVSIKSKKISKPEKSSSKRLKISKGLSENILKVDAVASSGFSPKTNPEGTLIPEDSDGHRQTKFRRNASGRKDEAPNAIKLTGSAYKKAFKNQRRPNNRQKDKVGGSGSASSKSMNLEKGRATEMVRSTVFLSTSETNLSADDIVVHSHEEMPHPKGTGASGMKDKSSDMIKVTSLEDTNAGFVDQRKPYSTQEKVESERGLEGEDHEAEADSSKKLNGRKRNIDELKDLFTQWETVNSNLESIVAEYRRNNAYGKR